MASEKKEMERVCFPRSGKRCLDLPSLEDGRMRVIHISDARRHTFRLRMLEPPLEGVHLLLLPVWNVGNSICNVLCRWVSIELNHLKLVRYVILKEFNLEYGPTEGGHTKG